VKMRNRDEDFHANFDKIMDGRIIFLARSDGLGAEARRLL
jgi:hypothetical protein